MMCVVESDQLFAQAFTASSGVTGLGQSKRFLLLVNKRFSSVQVSLDTDTNTNTANGMVSDYTCSYALVVDVASAKTGPREEPCLSRTPQQGEQEQPLLQLGPYAVAVVHFEQS